MIRHEPNFKRKCIFIFSTSLILEVFQYILTVGGTGITDLITNTCGGMTGIGLYWSAEYYPPWEPPVSRLRATRD
ncbi:MAG: VanZ family protein [Lachnospiraceae bacterium]|nr:VanZ family protein [Lachnospiraceae bacterium]